MDPLSDKIKKNITFVSIDIGSYSTKSLSSNYILNKTFEYQIDSATRYQLSDIPSNSIHVKCYSKDAKASSEAASNTALNKRDEIIKYDYLNIRPKYLIDKIKLYNVNYSNTPEYYEDMEDDEACSSGVCLDNTTGIIGYKLKPPNQKSNYFISYDYLLQRYVDLYLNELVEKMNPQGQNKKLILLFTLPPFEEDPNKATTNKTFKCTSNLTKKRYIHNIKKGLSSYKENVIGVVYMTEIESLVHHWKMHYEKQLLQELKIPSNEPTTIPNYEKKVLFIDFGCYSSKYYLTTISSKIYKNGNKENKIDNFEVEEWDVLNISGEKINQDIIQLLLKKYPDIKKGCSKALGKYKLWRTVDQEIKRAFTNPNVKDFSCEILNSGDYFDLMLSRTEINTILNPYGEDIMNTIKSLLSKYDIGPSELEICFCGDGALIFKDYLQSQLIDSDPIVKEKVHTFSWNKVNTLHGSLLKLYENVNNLVITNRRRRISTLSEKRSLTKILVNQHSFDSIISMENNLKQIFNPPQKMEFSFNPNQISFSTSQLSLQNKLLEKAKSKAISDSSISEYSTEDIIDFKNVDDVMHYLNTNI